MPGFCVSCGSPLGSGKFCPSCGAAVPSAPATPVAQSAPVAAAPAAAAGGGGLVKVLIIVFGIIGLFLVLGLGSCAYIAYRAKQKMTEFAQAPGSNQRYTGTKDACTLIKASEVSQAIGQPATLDESSSSSSTCVFSYGLGGANKIAVQFTWEGGALTMKMAHGAMKQISAGMDTFTPISGLGDEAYFLPAGSGVMMRKGDVMVHVDLRMAGLNTDAGKRIATIVASRL